MMGELDDIPEAVSLDQPEPSGQQPPRPPVPQGTSGFPILTFLLTVVLIPAAALIFVYVWLVMQAGQSVGSAEIIFELKPRHSFAGQTESLYPLWTFEHPDLETELEVVRSAETLINVVKELDLAKQLSAPDEASALRWLRANSRVRHAGGRMIAVSANGGGDPVLARDIANTIGMAYRHRVEEQSMDSIRRLLEELQLEAKGLEMLFEESRATLLNLLKDSNLIDLAHPDDPAIETALMRLARNSTVPLTPEQVKALRDESRRSIDALAAKKEYVRNAAELQRVRKIISQVNTAAKLPRRSIEIHQRAGIADPVSAPVFTAASGKIFVWALVASFAIGISLFAALVLAGRQASTPRYVPPPLSKRPAKPLPAARREPPEHQRLPADDEY